VDSSVNLSVFSECYPPKGLRRTLVLKLALCSAVAGLSAHAQEAENLLKEWEIVPRISVETTYSDNINQAPDDEAEADLVLQVNPGISMRKQGGRLEWLLDYTAQGVLYANNSDANTINNYLRTFGTAELHKDHLFVDAYGSISKTLISSNGRLDPGGPALGGGDSENPFNPGTPGNISLTDNQTTASSFGVSPYWRQNFGGWAEGLLRYRYDNTGYGLSEFDSSSHAVDFNLASGRQFSLLSWNLDYAYQRQESGQGNDNADDGNGEDDERESVVGQAQYRLSDSWSLLAEGGYENNQLTTFDEDNRNGSYWGLGAIWRPGRQMTLTGLYGPNVNEISLQWNPSIRTSLQISRRDQAVGVNPGVHWEGLFSHRLRFSTWSASYSEEVTNNQQLLSDSLIRVGPDGRPIILDDQGQVVVVDEPFGLSNEDFLRKRFDAGVTYQRGRTGVGFNIFNEIRQFQNAASDESAYGVNTLWNWRFAARTASFLRLSWERDDLSDDQSSDYWTSEVGLTRTFNPDMDGLISYRYYQNDTELEDQGFRENRLNARLNMRF
jgi:uncharacterized protein (PEP-CTERM system associated)